MVEIHPKPSEVARRLSEDTAVKYVTGTRTFYESGNVGRDIHIQMDDCQASIDRVKESLEEAGYDPKVRGLTDTGRRIVRAE